MPNTKWLQKTFKILPKRTIFAQYGHTGCDAGKSLVFILKIQTQLLKSYRIELNVCPVFGEQQRMCVDVDVVTRRNKEKQGETRQEDSKD